MSFLLNKPTEAAPHSIRGAHARRVAAAPVFKPEFVRSLRMHPTLAAVVAALVFVVIFGYAFRQHPLYEAESLVQVEPSALKPLSSDTEVAFDATRYDSYLQQQMQTAQRLDILVAAIHNLPQGTWRQSGETEQEAASRLQAAIKIARVTTSYQLSFTLRGEDPAKTARTLNAIVTAYLSKGRKDELTQSDQRTQILLEERQRIEQEMTQDKAEQASLSAALGMANPGLDAGNAYDSQLAGLRVELATAREAHDMAAAQLDAVSGQDIARTSGLTAAADEIIASDAGLSSMKSTINQRRAVLSGQMAGLTPDNPVYKQDQEEIADLDKSLDAMTVQMRDKAARRLQDKLRTDLARTGDVQSRLNAQLAHDTYSATSASPKLQRATELNADLHRLATRFASVDDSLRTLQLDASGPGMAHVALIATPPVYPLASRKHLLMAASLPVALLCGLFAAVLARKRDRHVYTARDLDEVLGFAPIAVLPAASDVSHGVLDEYMLRLAGGVEGAYRGSGARTFVLTAAGATTDIAMMAIALEDRLAHLGLAATTVTATAILNAHSTAAATRDDHVKIARREPLRNADGKNEGFAAVHLETLKTRHDLIFIHSPALLTSAETEYVVRVADATILVAESGVTTRQELLQAALLLERLHVRGIGAVLDGLQLRFADAAFVKAITELDRRQSAVSASTESLRWKTSESKTTEETSSSERSAIVPVTSTESTPAAVSTETETIVPLAAQALQSAPTHTAPLGTNQAHIPLHNEPEPMSQAGDHLPTQVMAVPALPLAPIQDAVIQDAKVDRLQLDAEAPARRGWLTRIFSGNDISAVSILPAEVSKTSAIESTSSSFADSAAFDLQPEPVVVTPVELVETAAEPEAHTIPAKPVPVRVELVEARLEEVYDTTAASAIAVPELADIPTTEAVMEPVLTVQAISTPVAADRQIIERPVAPHESAVSMPAPMLHDGVATVVPEGDSIKHDEKEEAAIVEASARTGRWDASPAPRQSGSWRDRRVAGSDAHIHPSLDRRFNWAVRAAELAVRNAAQPAPIAPAVSETATMSARPQLVTREPRLTRQWGLLSRFETGSTNDEPSSDEENRTNTQVGNDLDAREYRRG